MYLYKFNIYIYNPLDYMCLFEQMNEYIYIYIYNLLDYMCLFEQMNEYIYIYIIHIYVCNMYDYIYI